jgi:hypothetical protein
MMNLPNPEWSEEDQHFWYLDEIDRCKPWIEASLKRGSFQGVITHTFNDIKQMLIGQTAQLWATDYGCCITFVTHFPQASMLTLWLCGGDFEAMMNEIEKDIESWGRQEKCKFMYVMGRPGWKRKLRSRGFEEQSTVVSKLL